MRSAIAEISLLIAICIVLWLTTQWNPLFYISISLIGFYTIVIVLFIATKGSSMSLLDKALGIVALIGWLLIAWIMTQENGLQILGF